MERLNSGYHKRLDNTTALLLALSLLLILISAVLGMSVHVDPAATDNRTEAMLVSFRVWIYLQSLTYILFSLGVSGLAYKNIRKGMALSGILAIVCSLLAGVHSVILAIVAGYIAPALLLEGSFLQIPFEESVPALNILAGWGNAAIAFVVFFLGCAVAVVSYGWMHVRIAAKWLGVAGILMGVVSALLSGWFLGSVQTLDEPFMLVLFSVLGLMIWGGLASVPLWKKTRAAE